MPRGDGTGPMGLGPMTGRGSGYCAGFTAPGFANAVFGFCGGGRGVRGGGRGLRRMYPATGMPGWGGFAGYSGYPGAVAPPDDDPAMARLAAQQEASWLTRRIDAMEQELQNAKERLTGLTKSQE
jgi:hypothetical protein